ncbi:MAG: hypothetical protein JRI46_12430, partial [Deltaproteobacteria bacterium]|nr:hypothetical protein [Deltaproteobacteria bacterium]
MTREEDRQRLQRLRDEIDTLKHEGFDRQHPKFKEWSKEVKGTLKRLYGDGSRSLKKFEEIPFRRRGDRMWGEDYDIGGKERVVFKEDLERARAILEETLKKGYLPSEKGKGIDEEEFISSVSRGELHEGAPETAILIPEASAKEVGEKGGDVKIEELLQELKKDKKDLERVQSVLEEAMEEAQLLRKEGKGLDQEEGAPETDQLVPEVPAKEVVEMEREEKIGELLQQLEKEVKDPGVALRKVQRTMEELLRVKGKEALL